MIQAVLDAIELTRLLIASGFFGLTLIALIVAALVFPTIQSWFAAFVRPLGYISKFGRRKYIENRISSQVRYAAKTVNKQAADLIPHCKIEWVLPNDEKSFLDDDTVIIRVGFDKRDDDDNFYRASNALVHVGLLPTAKNFMPESTKRAVELVVLRLMLLASRQSAIRIFQKNFHHEDDQCREVFFELEAAEDRGLFRSLLLRELQLFEQVVNVHAPSPEILSEVERFFSWFFDLAARSRGERVELSFTGKFIRTGVMLVADDDVFEKHGIEAYIGRAYKYAQTDFPFIYILSRGQKKRRLVAEIVNRLCEKGEFTSVANPIDIQCVGPDGFKFATTIAHVRIERDVIEHKRWDDLISAMATGECVSAVIQEVLADAIVVLCRGIRVTILRSSLSAVELGNLRRFFNEDDELTLKIEAVDPGKHTLALSNVGTETDPRRALDNHIGESRVPARVRGVLVRESYSLGIFVEIPETSIEGFIPRNKATLSRFADLTKLYHEGQSIPVMIERYSAEHGKFQCACAELRDPWQSGPIPSVSASVEVTVRYIDAFAVTCELPGEVEGRIPATEIAWDITDMQEKVTNRFKIGERLSAVVTSVNRDRRLVILSVKRLEKNPLLVYAESQEGSVIEMAVTEVQDKLALGYVSANGQRLRCSLHRSEYSWLYCESIRDVVRNGEVLDVKVLGLAPDRSALRVSRKALTQNDFNSCRMELRPGDRVSCTVGRRIGNQFEVKIELSGRFLLGSLPIGEISNILYLDPPSADRLMAAHDLLALKVRAVNARHALYILSRKAAFSRPILGNVYSVKTLTIGDITYVYSEAVEGRLINSNPDAPPELDVIPATTTGDFAPATPALAKKS